MKKLLVLLSLLFFVNPVLAIEDIEIKNGDTLYLVDCVKIAINNSPVIKKAEQKLLEAKANVQIAKSDYFPTLNASVGYGQKFNSNELYDDGYTKRNLPTVDVYLNQLIYNFGRTNAKIKMEKFYTIAAEHEYLDSICDTINDVKVKYCNVLQAKAIVDTEKKNLEISNLILEMTKKFYKQHKKSEIDCINAEVYLSDAKIRLTEANNLYNQAYADLCNSMYIAGSPDFEIRKIDTFDYYDTYFTPEFLETPKGQWHEITQRPYEKDLGKIQKLPFSMEEAFDSAYKNSPDIKALNAVIEAMKQSLVYIKRQFYPSLKAQVGYSFDNKYIGIIEETYSNNQLNVAVNLSTSVNAMQYRNEVKKGKIYIDRAITDLDLLKQNLYYSVKKSYLNVKTAEAQIDNSQDKVDKALKNLQIINKLYWQGKSDYLELQTARADYNNAKIDHIRKIYTYNVSLAMLERETHKHAEHIHEYIHQLVKEKGYIL